jgi:alkylmercury lyase
MTDAPQNLPLAEQPLDDQALLARAFWLLLDHGHPVEVGALADALQREPAAVAAAVDRLAQAGRNRRDRAGRLLGSHGLSVVPTRHELMVDGKRYWTWCAYDAVGILGALEADGRVRSRSPHSGRLIELDFHGGQPDATEAVVFLAEGPCRSVIDDWCPLVNLFEDDQAATAWARQHGIAGTARPVAQATHAGAAAWRAYLWPGTAPADCCPPAGPSTPGAEEGTHTEQD